MKNNPWDNIKISKKDNRVTGILADTSNILEFYWAKDIVGNLLLIVSATSEISINQKIPQLNGIDIQIDKYEKNNQLVFRLLSKNDIDIFYTLCNDLIHSTKQVKNEVYAIQIILKRLEQWQYFLKSDRKLIDKKQLKGLIGELYLIKKYLLANYNAEEVLAFWKAPLQSVQDFELNNMTIEVKTKSSVNSITISSYEQLFTELDNLYLFVVTLSDSTKNTNHSINIYNIIKDIKELIGVDNLLLIENFSNLLMQYGFIELLEYEDLYFIISSDEFYEVAQDFPKIIDIPDGIEKLNYKINLDTCKKFLVEENIFNIKGR